MTSTHQIPTGKVEARGAAPFLVWPVSRREFYMAIGIALLPALAWGLVIFGWRVLWMTEMTLLAAWIAHWALKRWTARGKTLILAHTIASAMVLAALCEPSWPWWIVALAGAAIPAVLWRFGGPGRERVHIAVVAVLLLRCAAPWLEAPAARGHAVLARDRLVMGDIENQTDGSLYDWPASAAITGYDALRISKPSRVAMSALDRLADYLAKADWSHGGVLERNAKRHARAILDDALVQRLPSVEMLMTGAVPGPIGTVSIIGLVCGGLYLAYRHILRLRSAGLFFGSFALGMAALAVWPGDFVRLGLAGAWTAWEAFPEEIAMLLGYAIFNSDVLFAAIIILALPGTEPLTTRGRRVFLVAAAVLAALMTRLNWPIPAATVSLCLLMPFTAWFDRWFGKRSWMNRLRM